MSEQNGQAEETPKERKLRQRREANARWRARPGNMERQREAQAKWQADPKNREKVRASRAKKRAALAERPADAGSEPLDLPRTAGPVPHSVEPY